MEPEPSKVATAAPPPSPEVLDMMVLQLEGIMSSVKAPAYVEVATQEFITALKKWAGEGR
jgi:hypothetical protein